MDGLFFLVLLFFPLVSLSPSSTLLCMIRCSDERKKNQQQQKESSKRPCHSLRFLLSGLLANPGVLGGASLEAVLESSGNVLEVAGAASADGPSPLGLLAPVVCEEEEC